MTETANIIAEPHVTDREWAFPHYLAAAGIVFVVYQMIGWVGWLADGPVQMNRFRDPDSISWYVCRFYEAVAILSTVAIGWYLWRQCRREGTLLTFDVMFCIACFSLYWQDPLANFFQPLFEWSQNWVNLNDWLAYLPFSPNPDAGRAAEPIIFDGLNYLSGWLGFAMILNIAMAWWERRFPAAKKVQLVALAFVIGAIIDIVLEAPMYYFDTWQFPGSPDVGIWADTGHKFPAYEFISGAIMFSLVASVRYFRDEEGLRIVERGLQRYTNGVKKFFVLASMIGLFNIVYLLDNSVYWFLGIYSGPYKEMPAHIIGGHCDAPGVTGTRYGRCPGSPGYRIPLEGSLPGSAAYNNPEWLNGPKQCDTCDPVRVENGPDAAIPARLDTGRPPS